MTTHMHPAPAALTARMEAPRQMLSMAPPPLQLFAGPENEVPATLESRELSGEALEKARKWAAESDIGSEAIQQVQSMLGIDQSGVYDDATLQAVYRFQLREAAEGRRVKEDGIASEAFFRRNGLIFTRKITAATALPDFAAAILKEDGSPRETFQNGVTIGTYTHYDEQNPNNKTFWQVANPWAEDHSAIGISDTGALEVGKPVKITETGHIIEAVQAISRGLVQLWRDTLGENATGEPPAWTKVRNLAIFAHGMPYGIGTDSDHEDSYRHGLISTAPSGYKKSAPNIASFAEGLQGAIPADVNVQLFACNSAREFDSEDPYKKAANEHRQMPDGQDLGSDNSFAAILQQELGAESTVFGHLTAGHTTDNFTSIAYGAQAGPGGRAHMFDLLYPDSFIDSEMQRLFPELAAGQQTALRPLLREQMWDHYKDSISDEYLRQAGRTEVRHWDQSGLKEGEGPRMRDLGDKMYEQGIPDLGALMMMDSEAAKELMHESFRDKWMTADRINSLRNQAGA